MASGVFVNGQTVNIVSGGTQSPGTSPFGLVLSDPAVQNFNFQSPYDTYAGSINSGSTTYYTGFVGAYGYGGGNMSMSMSLSGGTAAPGLYDFELQRTGSGGGTWNCSSCFEVMCSAPTSLNATNVTGSSADLNWLGSVYATSFDIEYGPAGFTQGTGTSDATGSNSLSISGLTPGTAYDFYVRAICSPGDFSAWSSASFSTTPLLNVVSGSPQVNTTTAFGLVISDPSAQDFFLAGSTTTYSASITAGSTTYFTGLTDGYTYNGGNMSLNMGIAGGGTPAPGDYDVNLVRNGGLNWNCEDCFQFVAPLINESCAGAITIPVAHDTTIVSNGYSQDGPNPNCSNSSGADDDAWYVFTGTGTPIEIHGSIQGGSDDFVLEVWDGCPGGGGSLIACNDDANAPTDYMPKIQMCTEAGTAYYMRIFEWNTTTGLDQMGLTIKEVRPVITGNGNVGTQGMTINFEGYQGGNNQIIRYHEFGNSPNYSWKILPSTAQSGYVNGLDPHTRYTFRVGSKCPGEGAAYGDTATFWTRALPCTTPTASDSVIEGDVVISWNSTNANYYKIRYRMVGGSWSYEHTGQTSLTLSGLASGNYEWQIRAICNAGGNQPYSALDTFTIVPERLASLTEGDDEFGFNLYPNPTNGLVSIEFARDVEATVTFNVFDLTGKTVFNRTFASQRGLNRLSLDLSGLETGVYLTTLSDQSGISKRVRIVLN